MISDKMGVRLKEDAEPKGTITKEEFCEQLQDDDTFWRIPLKYYNIKPDGVYLRSDIASEIVWKIDGETEDKYNIAALAQVVWVEEERLTINPGFWCSYIDKEKTRVINNA